jgi:murein DD-endopeptidase MepM/ murein hydrolase activator NlpD
MRYQQLRIFRPMISKNITQKFAENKACVDGYGRIYGVKAGQKCPMSYYESIGMKGHSGIDIPAILGEEVYHAGTYNGWWHTEVDSAGGIGVDVVSNEPLFFPFPIPTELINTAVPYEQDGVNGFIHYVKMRYWHLYAPVGFEKKQVTCGTVVGQAGNTGASSGTHLHFAPKWCLKDGRGVASNNGYTGAFDPAPYYDHSVTAKDHATWLQKEVIPLSKIEQKDMIESLGSARRLLLELQKLIHKI